jgi:hypothetical protein
MVKPKRRRGRSSKRIHLPALFTDREAPKPEPAKPADAQKTEEVAKEAEPTEEETKEEPATPADQMKQANALLLLEGEEPQLALLGEEDGACGARYGCAPGEECGGSGVTPPGKGLSSSSLPPSWRR